MHFSTSIKWTCHFICQSRLVHYQRLSTEEQGNSEDLWRRSNVIRKLLPPANEVCEGYVFTGVCLSTGGCLPHCMLGYPPGPEADTSLGRHPPQVDTPGQTPPRQTPPRQTPPLHSACWDPVNKPVVRIPLECIFVFLCGMF